MSRSHYSHRGRLEADANAAVPNSPLQSPGQSELMERVVRQEVAAFSELYDQLSRPMFSMALRITGNTTDAEDAVQLGFQIVWFKANDYQPSLGTPFSWVCTIIRRKAIDLLRRNVALSERLSKFLRVDNVPPTAEDGCECMITKEKRVVVGQLLAGLSNEERELIEAAFFSGLTQAEMAKALGLPLGTVKSRIRRSLLKLRAMQTKL